MPKRRAIPIELHAAMLKKYHEGMIAKEIQQWLKDEHGLSVSESTMFRTLRLIRKERSEVTKDIYAKAAQETAMEDIEGINKLITAHFKDWEKLRKNNDTRLALQVTDRLVKLIELRKKFNGGEEINVNISHEIDEDELREDLAEKLGIKLDK